MGKKTENSVELAVVLSVYFDCVEIASYNDVEVVVNALLPNNPLVGKAGPKVSLEVVPKRNFSTPI